jgi:hypothetical protein
MPKFFAIHFFSLRARGHLPYFFRSTAVVPHSPKNPADLSLPSSERAHGSAAAAQVHGWPSIGGLVGWGEAREKTQLRLAKGGTAARCDGWLPSGGEAEKKRECKWVARDGGLMHNAPHPFNGSMCPRGMARVFYYLQRR